jgi:hypothetical protein
MKTRSKLLKEAYPVLLFISLLMSWELTSVGSPVNPGSGVNPGHSWFHETNTGDRACKLPLFTSSGPACFKEPGRITETPPFERRFPWSSPVDTRLQKAAAGWEAL